MRSMRNAGGYVKVHRSMMEWEWYDNHACKIIMLHLLLSANWEVKQWNGQTIVPGQVVTSIEKLSERLGLSRSTIRRSLTRMKVSGELTIQSNNHWTTITLANWGEYQSEGQPVNQPKNQQTTDQRPTSDRPVDPTKEVKKERSKENTERVREVDPVVEQFNALWKVYEGHGTKGLALARWKTLTQEDRDAIVAKAPSFVQSTPGGEYRNYLEGWINPAKRLWERPVVTRTTGPTAVKTPEQMTGAEARAELDKIRERNGIAPGEFLSAELIPPALWTASRRA